MIAMEEISRANLSGLKLRRPATCARQPDQRNGTDAQRLKYQSSSAASMSVRGR
jgi:hypothetical protein